MRSGKFIGAVVVGAGLFSNSAMAFHDTPISNQNIAFLGGLFTQVFVYEQQCGEHQHFNTVVERLPNSPRFEQYNDEVEHMTDRQNLAYERGGAAGVASGAASCDTIALVLWEWFG
jgi:hypothetical protein